MIKFSTLTNIYFYVKYSPKLTSIEEFVFSTRSKIFIFLAYKVVRTWVSKPNRCAEGLNPHIGEITITLIAFEYVSLAIGERATNIKLWIYYHYHLS